MLRLCKEVCIINTPTHIDHMLKQMEHHECVYICVYITLYIICTACTRNFLKPVFLYIFLLGHPGGLPNMKQHLQVNAANHWTLCGLQAQGAQALLQKHWQWMAMNDCCAQGTPAKNITRSKFRAHTHTLSLSLVCRSFRASWSGKPYCARLINICYQHSSSGCPASTRAKASLLQIAQPSEKSPGRSMTKWCQVPPTGMLMNDSLIL